MTTEKRPFEALEGDWERLIASHSAAMFTIMDDTRGFVAASAAMWAAERRLIESAGWGWEEFVGEQRRRRVQSSSRKL